MQNDERWILNPILGIGVHHSSIMSDLFSVPLCLCDHFGNCRADGGLVAAPPGAHNRRKLVATVRVFLTVGSWTPQTVGVFSTGFLDPPTGPDLAEKPTVRKKALTVATAAMAVPR